MNAQVGIASASPVAAAKNAHGDGEGLIVDEARVDGEDGHQQQHISPCTIEAVL